MALPTEELQQKPEVQLGVYSGIVLVVFTISILGNLVIQFAFFHVASDFQILADNPNCSRKIMFHQPAETYVKMILYHFMECH